MKKCRYLLIALISIQSVHSQKRTFKCEKVYDAVKLIDENKYDEGINLLKECEKIDSTDYTYPYEIALAYTYKKDYQNAISQLEKIKNYSNIRDDYFQLLGNNYDYANQPENALKIYDEGLKKFPNSGRLYLEKGVMSESKNPVEAIKIYEKGIKNDPTYPSNYYRVSRLYLNSNDKLSGLIYGEIFINLERTTSRTQEISDLLYKGYKNSITFQSNDNTKIDFCKVIIDAEKFEKSRKYPLCMIFGKNFILSTINQKEFNLNTLAAIRNEFVKQYFKEDYKEYPNVLFDYLKIMDDNKVLNAYNHYVFQIGDEKAFDEWQKNNQIEYDKFEAWYTAEGNVIKINNKNVFISDQIK
jgi:tetratricopeptide (TPR) repeat protein